MPARLDHMDQRPRAPRGRPDELNAMAAPVISSCMISALRSSSPLPRRQRAEGREALSAQPIASSRCGASPPSIESMQ